MNPPLSRHNNVPPSMEIGYTIGDFGSFFGQLVTDFNVNIQY